MWQKKLRWIYFPKYEAQIILRKDMQQSHERKNDFSAVHAMLIQKSTVNRGRGIQFMDKTIEVNERIIDRLNGVYDQLLKRFLREYN